MDIHFRIKHKDHHIHLAVHGQKIISTLTSLGNGIQRGAEGWETHHSHVRTMRTGGGRSKFVLNVVGNCLACGKDIYCDGKTIWDNGKLVDFSYQVEGIPLTRCPECDDDTGLTHTGTLGFA